MMEILILIGIIIVAVAVFAGGGVLGWILKGLGSVFDLLLDGWSTLMKVIFWGFIIIMFLMAVLAG
ncbi:MAG: hypothetical protein IJ659_09275 [Alloprevotella sp.]|nr:hypothetical protein [Alloprevotella sp.]MBR1594944.1 hypothetical protein [Alloprevotella sp.]